MNQKARPVSDISTGHWTPTPISPQVNGSTGGGEVSSNPAYKGDTFQVKLANLEWPDHWNVDPTGQTLTVHLNKTEAGSLPTTVALRQGGNVIKVEEFEPSGSKTLTLTADEAKQITNYHDLSVSVTAGNPVVPCCNQEPSPVHAALVAAFHDSNCSELNGASLILLWDPGTSFWIGTSPVCNIPLEVKLHCGGTDVNGFTLTAHWYNSTGCTVPIPGILQSGLCDPFFLHFIFNLVGVSGNCPCCADTLVSGQIDVTLLPTP